MLVLSGTIVFSSLQRGGDGPEAGERAGGQQRLRLDDQAGADAALQRAGLQAAAQDGVRRFTMIDYRGGLIN